jgi:hypothetical protein
MKHEIKRNQVAANSGTDLLKSESHVHNGSASDEVSLDDSELSNFAKKLGSAQGNDESM